MPEYNRPAFPGDGKICSGCGVLVFNQMQHDAHHEDLTIEREQLQEELASADLRAAGEGERCAAAVRLADAARAVHAAQQQVQNRRVLYKEFLNALELWESVR